MFSIISISTSDWGSEMKFVNKHTLVAINRLCTIHSGGATASSSNIRPGQSLGFVDRIFTNELFGVVLYPDIFHRAAAYMFHVIKDHVFIDGNKRTGLAAGVTFLVMNNIEVTFPDDDTVFDFVIETASGPNDPETVIPRIARWLSDNAYSSVD
jgi:death-on-curing family protein